MFLQHVSCYQFFYMVQHKSAVTIKFIVDQNLSPIEKIVLHLLKNSNKIQLHIDLTIAFRMGKIRLPGTAIRIPEAS